MTSLTLKLERVNLSFSLKLDPFHLDKTRDPEDMMKRRRTKWEQGDRRMRNAQNNGTIKGKDKRIPD